MHKEYFLKGHFGIRGMGIARKGFSRTITAMDEYDALCKVGTKLESELMDIPSGYLYMNCLIRPTNRSDLVKKELLQHEDNRYNRSVLSRYQIRFLMAETIDELDGYAEEFKKIKEDREFNEAKALHQSSLDSMRKLYKRQKDYLVKGKIKPVSFDLRENRPVHAGSNILIDHYCNRVSTFLRLFGYKVRQEERCFILYQTQWHGNSVCGKRIKKYTPLELVWFWEKTAESHQIRYQSTIRYVGGAGEGKMDQVLQALDEHEIKAYAHIDDIGLRCLYVLNEEFEKSERVLAEKGLILNEWESYF